MNTDDINNEIIRRRIATRLKDRLKTYENLPDLQIVRDSLFTEMPDELNKIIEDEGLGYSNLFGKIVAWFKNAWQRLR